MLNKGDKQFISYYLQFLSYYTYFAHRYYNSQIGRFITLDPVDDKKGTSPYAYCSNNPLKFTDPTGEVKSYAQVEEMFQIYGSWKAGQPDLWSTFASWPGSMASYMKAHPEFYAQVYLNEFISQMRFYFAKHNYFRQTYQYGSTTIETYLYFNAITMSVMVGMNRYDNPELVAGSGAGLGSTYGPAEEASLMNYVYTQWCIANYRIHGSTIVLSDWIRVGSTNIWACGDWAYEAHYMFEGMNLKYWRTEVVNLYIHAIVRAKFGTETMYYDPWIEAPILYGLSNWLRR